MNASLGTHTKSASTFEDDSYRLARRRRYAAQKTASHLLPGHRVCACGWRPPPGGQIGISRRGAGRHYVSGVAVCGSVWACPVCASKIALQRSAELERAVSEWESRGGAVWLLTLTVNHAAPDALDKLLQRFTEAMRALWSGRWGQSWRADVEQVGMVRNIEVTWGMANGWHPHCHALLFVSASSSAAEAEVRIKQRWQSVASRYGFSVTLRRGATLERAADARAAADYATKSDDGSQWGAAQELTWANIKRSRGARFTPFALLAACDSSDVGGAPALFQTYVDAFRGRRQLVWSRGLRAELLPEPERSDEDVANAHDDQAVFVCAVDTAIFCWVKARGLLCDLLELADDEGLAGVTAFLEWAYDCRMYEARSRAA